MTDSPATSARSIDRIVVVHGATATPDRHWYPAFAEAMSRTGVAVTVPALPDPMQPDPAAWGRTIADAVGQVDERTMLVTHSLGTPALLQHLSALEPGWRLGALITVAGFSEVPPGGEIFAAFVAGIDSDAVRDATAARHAIISTDDPRIPAELTYPLAEALGATVHEVDAAGHFMDDDGVADIPVLNDLAASIVTASRPGAA